MTIAISVTMKPSRLLQAIVILMSFLAFAIGALILAGLVVEQSISIRLLLATFSFFLGFFGFYHGVPHRKHQHIDISGTGQVRLGEVNLVRGCTALIRPHVKMARGVVRILDSSTITPHLLLLRLQPEKGKMKTLLIMPDSMSRDKFRALSIACRWITRSNHAAESAKL